MYFTYRSSASNRPPTVIEGLQMDNNFAHILVALPAMAAALLAFGLGEGRAAMSVVRTFGTDGCVN